MSGYVIRLANFNDAGGIAQVHVQSWRETYRGLVPDSFLTNLSVEQRTGWWRKIFEDQDDTSRVLVAVVQDRVVGFSYFGKEREGDLNYKGEMYALYLLKEFQGVGIGRALFQSSILSFVEMGFSSMLLWVFSENPTRNFYKHMGGKFLREKAIQVGDVELFEAAYGYDLAGDSE